MSVNEKVASDVQNLAAGVLVNLYEIDLTTIGGNTTLYFTPSIDNDYTPITFNGQDYTAINMETQGFEISGEGQLPSPTFKVSNAVLTFASYVTDYEDFVGARFTRRRTFKKYLDGEAEADPNAQFPVDIYVISRKLSHNKYFIEYELSAYMDFHGTKLPKRQVIRDTCTHRYRYYIDGDFVYTNATCPYTKESSQSPSYFDRVGDYSTDPTDDSCGKTLTECELRFACNRAFSDSTASYPVTISDTAPGGPSTNDYWLDTSTTPNVLKKYNGSSWITYKPSPLPTRAFPSVSRLRIS